MRHRNHNIIREELIERIISFKGIYNIVKKVYYRCVICNAKNKANKTKSENFKLIIFQRPRVRYIFDLTDILIELRGNTKYLYISNVVNHLTIFDNSYLFRNKAKISILEKIKNFIDDLGPPKEMEFNNVREFVNKFISSYLKEKNIKIIKGKTYHPRSQGA